MAEDLQYLIDRIQKEAVEKGNALRKVKFEGFATQYDEIKAW